MFDFGVCKKIGMKKKNRGLYAKGKKWYRINLLNPLGEANFKFAQGKKFGDKKHHTLIVL